jgi:hypothetical protein
VAIVMEVVAVAMEFAAVEATLLDKDMEETPTPASQRSGSNSARRRGTP